jgi:two-component system, cell cycle sensor histidine kinase and response regulator CckA
MSKIRVLLVDDDEGDAAVTKAMLRDASEPLFAVDWVRTYEDALARMTGPPSAYDVFILDYRLGGHSGLDLMMAAQAAGRNEPIVLLAGHEARGRDEEAMRAGAADYLAKGELTAPQLQRAIRFAVMRAAAARGYTEGDARLIHAQRMESLGRLVGSVAHDFNNLLTGILGYASILEREVALTHPGRRPVEEIRKAAEMASRLTRQLLAYSRKPSTPLAPLDLNDVLEGLTDMLERLVGDHLTLVIEHGDHVPAVLVDRAQIEQVVINLVLNARDASRPGGRIVLSTGSVLVSDEDVRRDNFARGGQFATVTVEDSGDGMTAEALEHLFEPFFTTKPVGRGTGLGLASANGIVRQAGGVIRVDSEAGRGTTVSVVLPESVGERRKPEPPAAPRPADLCGTETVLVVEDDETVRIFAGEALTFYGYRVLLAADPQAGLRIAREAREPIHAALTDLVLPGMGGVQLAQELTHARPAIRIVYMSGYHDGRDEQTALPADSVFLRKPFQADDLARLLRAVLDRTQARSAR